MARLSVRPVRLSLLSSQMTYVQGVTGSGGWPLSVFLSPELEPLYGGTVGGRAGGRAV